MNNFKLIKRGIETAPLLQEIESTDNVWDLQTGRQGKIAVQREAQSIPLRGLVKSKINGRKRRDGHESRFTTTSHAFPVACAFLYQIAEDRNAHLSRGKIVRLRAGARVYPHIDRGDYYRLRDRFHLVLRSPSGSYMKTEDETVSMEEGELWWFDNKKLHESHNEGKFDRIHMIFDLLPAEYHLAVFPVAEAS